MVMMMVMMTALRLAEFRDDETHENNNDDGNENKINARQNELFNSSPMSSRGVLRLAEKSNFIRGSSSPVLLIIRVLEHLSLTDGEKIPALVISIFWKTSLKSKVAKVLSSSSKAASPSSLGLRLIRSVWSVLEKAKTQNKM